MFETICYFSILLTILSFCLFTRNKTITFGEKIIPSKGFVGKFILFEYVVIAFFSIICLKMGLVINTNIRFWPYVLMTVSIMIVISPFLEYSPDSIDLTKMEYNKAFPIITIIYLFATIVVTVMLWGNLKSLLTSGAWSDNRILGYTGMDVAIYRNGFEWISVNIVNYLKIIAMVIMMYYFVNGFNRLWGVLLFIATFLNTATISMYSSSRGTIFNYMLLLLLMYILYRKSFESRIRHVVDKILVLFGAGALIYAIAVTNSRFGGSDNSSRDSLFFYFGHAPIVFNQNVSTINGYGYGSFFWYGLLNLLSIGVNLTQESIGGTWGKQFYTYIGTWYIDFGFVGVIVLSFVFSGIVKKLVKNSRPLLSTCFAIFFAASFLIEGAFVIGRFYCLTLIINVGIFLILRFMENKVRLK